MKVKTRKKTEDQEFSKTNVDNNGSRGQMDKGNKKDSFHGLFFVFLKKIHFICV